MVPNNIKKSHFPILMINNNLDSHLINPKKYSQVFPLEINKSNLLFYLGNNNLKSKLKSNTNLKIRFPHFNNNNPNKNQKKYSYLLNKKQRKIWLIIYLEELLNQKDQLI